MAHELQRNDHMFSANGIAPWHGLGTVIEEEGATAARAMELAHLDWTVELRPVYACCGDIVISDEVSDDDADLMDDHELCAGGLATPDPAGLVHLPTARAVSRTDTNDVLGVVGSRYLPLQNSEAFGFMDGVLGEHGAHYETAGSLKGNTRIWLLAKLPQTMTIIDDDRHETYMLLYNSHDGSSTVTVTLTSVRVVCNNTLQWALNRKDAQHTFHIRHTASMTDKVARAQEILGIAPAFYAEIERALKALTKIQFDEKRMHAFARDLLKVPSDMKDVDVPGKTRVQVETLDRLFVSGTGQDIEGVGGTAYAALNAVTEFDSHERRVRGKTPADKAERRLDAIWTGTGTLQNSAIEQLLDLTN